MYLTKQQIEQAIEKAWDAKPIKMNWPGMERCIRSALELPDIPADSQIVLIDEIVAAFTHRGHSLPQ